MKEKEEAEEAEDPHPPPDSAYRICYRMANYGQISDFKMFMVYNMDIHTRVSLNFENS